MRLICPHCMNGGAVSDDAAGKEATCPNCGKSFPTPARYTAVVSGAASAVASAAASAPVPPPGLVPPVPAPVPHSPTAPPGYVPPAPVPPDGFLQPPAPSAESLTPVGYTHSVGISISPKVVAWLPAVLLALVFALTFFPWVGAYAGSTAVYSQRPWGAMSGGSPNRNYKFEEAGTIPSDWIDKMRSDWRLMVPFFLLLLTALVFAWAERGVRSLDPRKVPPLAKLWPWRNSIVAAGAALALFFLVWEMANGFSMERAIRQHIAEQFAERREKAAASPATLAKLEYEEEQTYDAYHVERTWWLYLALGCNALAVAAVMARVGLDNRGNKPPPKLVLHY